jgi:peptide/nickel transport system permease protein
MLSRLINGARVSLFAMSTVLASALLIGVVVGSLAGYIGGKVELVLISIIDIVLSLPSLIVALAFIGIFGPGYWSMVAALTMAWWANYARMSRAVVASELHQPYIEAAWIMGSSHLRIFTRHILPHVLALVVVYASADAGALVLAIATLSFLGLGVEPPTPEWGQMLVDGMSYLEEYPQLVILPGLALTLVVVGFNLLGEYFALLKVPRTLSGSKLRRLKAARRKEEEQVKSEEAQT